MINVLSQILPVLVQTQGDDDDDDDDDDYALSLLIDYMYMSHNDFALHCIALHCIAAPINETNITSVNHIRESHP